MSLIFVLLLVTLISQTCFSFQTSRYLRQSKQLLMMAKGDNVEKENWWMRNDDEEVIVKVVEDAVLPSGFSLFDDAYSVNALDGKVDKYSVSELTLREISEAYQFSLAYLGDFVVQQGCPPPVDVDTKLSNILMAEQIYTLLEALTSLDPFDSNVEYDSLSVTELADDLDIPIGRIIRICTGEGFNLPYGLDTMLHEAVVERIREVYEFDDYVDDVLDNQEDYQNSDGEGDAVNQYDEYGEIINNKNFNFDTSQ
jgi:hypothetical protein